VALDGDYLYEGLLRYNYFPMVKEKRDDIPPFFATDTLSPDVANQLAAIPDSAPRKKDGFDQVEYRTTRFNNVLRLMHIPHPKPYARLCASLRDNWPKLDYVCTNGHSQIKPQRHDDGRVITIDDYQSHTTGRVVVMEKERFPGDVEAHLSLSFGSRYLVDADVSACFPSIYSHAIPWALVGHVQAKQNRSNAEWFNHIDWCQRHMKRGETQGVPVGPATSNIINEVVLARVDASLAGDGYRFLRYIDDYKCYCESREEAEEFLRDLEAALGQYLLGLNAKKVSIVELPVPSKSEWIIELASRLPDTKTATARQIVSFLDAATSRQRLEPDGSVLKYASRSLLNKVDQTTVGIFCQYLSQIALHYPIVLPVLCEAARRLRVKIPHDHLNAMLEQQIKYRRADMACWVIYLFGLTGHAVPQTLADSIAKSGDCFPMTALLAVNSPTDEVVARVDQLAGCHAYEKDKYWLLLHELSLRGLLKIADVLEYVEESGLKLLAENNITFLRAIEIEDQSDGPVSGIENESILDDQSAF